MLTSNHNAWRYLIRVLLAAAIAFVMVYVLLLATHSDAQVRAGTNDTIIYLPIVTGGDFLSGTYDCLEYEFGLIWTSEVITLHPNGFSEYLYAPPYSGYVTGTWTYSASLMEVAFTNFRWMTATFIPPDRLWNSQYLPGPDFDIAISCNQR